MDTEHHTGQTSVYRYYDRNNLLLYVGITSRGIARNFEHNATKAWWQFVDQQRVDHYSTRDAARAAERQLIRQYRPPFNVQHNPTHMQDSEAYLEFRATGEKRLLDINQFKALGKTIPLEKYDALGSLALFRSHLAHPLLDSLPTDLSPKGVALDGAGHKSSIKSLWVHDGRLVCAVLGANAAVAESARACLRYLTLKPPYKVNVRSIVITRRGKS